MNVRVQIKTNWKNMQLSMIFRLRTLKNRSFRQVSSVWRHAFALYLFAMIGLLVYSLSSSAFSADLSSVAPPSCLCFIYFIFLLVYLYKLRVWFLLPPFIFVGFFLFTFFFFVFPVSFSFFCWYFQLLSVPVFIYYFAHSLLSILRDEVRMKR